MMSDRRCWQMVNRAQIDHATQAVERHVEPAVPAIRRLQRSMEFIDLVAACDQFTATVERPCPREVRGRRVDGRRW